jgi:hypothetical protein
LYCLLLRQVLDEATAAIDMATDEVRQLPLLFLRM